MQSTSLSLVNIVRPIHRTIRTNEWAVIPQNSRHNFCIIKQNNSMKILLAKIMYERNLSVRQVAILSGITKSAVQKVMNEDSNPTIRTLEKLAEGLKCKISDLYESDYQ